MIDVTIKTPIKQNTSIRVDVRNLLDSRYTFTQGTLEREGYNVGRMVSAGISINK